MTTEKFKALSLNRKADIVCLKGVLLGERETSYFEVSLFGIDGFYVEVFYHKKYKTTHFEAFDNPCLLSPYLSEINLTGLF